MIGIRSQLKPCMGWGGRLVEGLWGRAIGSRCLSRCAVRLHPPNDGQGPVDAGAGTGAEAKKAKGKGLHSEFGKFGKFVLPPSELLEFDQQGLHGRLFTQGAGMDLLDRNGHMNPWKACRCSEYVHKCVVLDPRYALGEFTTRDRTTVVVTTEYTFHPAVYLQPGAAWFGRPLFLGQQLVNLGKTSFDINLYIDDATDGERLSENVCRCVFMDYKTGSPIEIPSELRERFKPYFTGDYKPATYQPKKKTADIDNMFQLEHEVRSSDIDANMHLNNHSYPRLCWDAAAFAVHQGKFKNFKDDLLNYRPRMLNMAYLRSAKMGAKLIAYAWEDPEDPLTIHFQLDDNDKPILRTSLVYYSAHEMVKLKI